MVFDRGLQYCTGGSNARNNCQGKVLMIATPNEIFAKYI